MKKIAIIVAAGIGNRMQSVIPKQFLPLAGKLVLMHSIEKFYQAGAEVIITLHPDYESFWKKACEDDRFVIPHRIVFGGKERFHSIQNAIESISTDEPCLVAIHDAARPNTSLRLIQKLYQDAELHKAIIPGVKPTDTLRSVVDNQTLNRNDFWMIQTPQIFEINLLKKAYAQEFNPLFTDDASVVEAIGVFIQVTDGEKNNIKITFPEDLEIMEYLFSKKSP